MKRREFIINTAAVAGGISLMPSIMNAKRLPVDEILNSDNDNILIIIEMFGGNDGINTIIPYHQPELYMQLRPNLHIPEEFAFQFGDSELFMNKALIDGVHNGGMLNLMATGKLAVVQGIGYDNPNLSHFRSRDIWHSGINSSDPNERLLDGWLGRYFAGKLSNFPEEIPEHPIAISLEGTIPLLLKSEKGDMGISLQNPEEFNQLSKGLTPKMPKFPTPLNNNYEKEFNFAHVIAEQSEKYAQEVIAAYNAGKDKVKVSYSEGLAQKFRVISALIAGGLQTKVYFVSLSNFDSHAQQMQADYLGAHYTLLNNVARGICEFLDDAQQQGFAERVAGMTVSEFGRRVNDNGSRGTDHGAASVQFLFAGSDDYIEGGYYRVDGKPDLNDLDENDNLRYQYDFRRTYNDMLETWLDASREESKAIFGNEFLPLGIMKKRIVGVSEYLKPQGDENALVFPNPTSGMFNIRFELKKYSFSKIEIFTSQGRKVATILEDYLTPGIHQFNYYLQNIGEYNISLTFGSQRFIKKLIIVK